MICCRRTHVPLLTFVGSIRTTGAKPHDISRVRFSLSKDTWSCHYHWFRHSVAFTIISLSIGPTSLNARWHRSVSVCCSGLASDIYTSQEHQLPWRQGSKLPASCTPIPKLIPNWSTSLIHPQDLASSTNGVPGCAHEGHRLDLPGPPQRGDAARGPGHERRRWSRCCSRTRHFRASQRYFSAPRQGTLLLVLQYSRHHSDLWACGGVRRLLGVPWPERPRCRWEDSHVHFDLADRFCGWARRLCHPQIAVSCSHSCMDSLMNSVLVTNFLCFCECKIQLCCASTRLSCLVFGFIYMCLVLYVASESWLHCNDFFLWLLIYTNKETFARQVSKGKICCLFDHGTLRTFVFIILQWFWSSYKSQTKLNYTELSLPSLFMVTNFNRVHTVTKIAVWGQQ